MSCEPTPEAVIEALRQRGDASGDRDWPYGRPNYVAEYSLTAAHVPALISLATQWVDEPSESSAVYGQVHAWRALGQLRAVETIQPLLDVQDDLDERGDDWYLEEFSRVFGLIGPPAIGPLKAYLSDESHRELPRSSAASGLAEIARRYPETREQVVDILTAELSRHQQNLGEFNGLVLSSLLDLRAAESAAAIERAFAANVIDPTVVGDWEDVRRELGVPGLGIAPDRSPGWPSIRERLGLRDIRLDQKQETGNRNRQQNSKRRAKLKRKQRRKDQKRNRKRR